MIYKILLLVSIANFAAATNFNAEHNFIPHIDNPNNKIEYYLIKPLNKNPKSTLIFLHGNQAQKVTIGGLKRVNDGTLARYAEMGYLAIAMSFPGYGNSDGERDWCGVYSQRAVVSLIEYLNSYKNIEKNRIYLIGNSRGAVVAGMVATKEQELEGIVLDAGFYDLNKVTHEITLSRMKNEGIINSSEIEKRSIMDKADKVHSPTLILHGFYDEKTPVAEAFKFYNKLMQLRKNATLMVFPYPHSIPLEQKYKAIDIFIEENLKSRNKKIK
ncbi:MAG: prolyl oligopeptidase family serine peptidase [Rickettsiales bacterium]